MLLLLSPLSLTLYSSLAFAQTSTWNGTFTLIGTHPNVAAQSSASGKIIATLHPFNNKLYIGYGDFALNTGPIAIAPYDPITNIFSPSLLSATTEAIYTYRTINGKLYAPAIDPSGGLVNYGYAIGEPWSNPTHGSLNAVHIFDVATLNGSDLYVVGSDNSIGWAGVWKSTDNGTTWKWIGNEPQMNSGDTARYHFAGVYNNKLYVQASDFAHGIHPKSYIYDGTSWNTNGPNLFSAASSPFVQGVHPTTFAGKMVYKTILPTYDKDQTIKNIITVAPQNELLFFNGTTVSKVPFPILDFAVDGNYLYALGADFQVKRTTDLQTWETIGTAPNTSYSIGVLNDYLYIGTTDSKLYKYSQPLVVTPTPNPSSTSKLGDIVVNDRVDLYDYNALLTDFGKENDAVTKADLDNDDDVDLYDYNILLSNFGK